MDNTALVLTGGGARAAYQVGALMGIKEICEKEGIPYPFSIYSGCSAGAVNTAFLANAHDSGFKNYALLERLWTSIHTNSVYRSDIPSILKIAKNIIWDVLTGKLSEDKAVNGMLDSSPLKELIEKHYDEKRVSKLIKDGKLKGFGVSAFNYSKNISEYFFQSSDDVKAWESHLRVGTKTKIKASHIYASASIPVMFPYVAMGKDYYGDGALRNYKPLNPCLHLGADKLFVIGVLSEKHNTQKLAPSTSRVVSTVLNSILLDSTNLELHYINKFNQLVKENRTANSHMKYIDTFVLRPSIDIGKVALSMSDDLPKMIQHLIRGLGKKKEGGDLISYLLFEPKFIKKLIEVGRKDALDQRKEILHFFKPTI